MVSAAEERAIEFCVAVGPVTRTVGMLALLYINAIAYMRVATIKRQIMAGHGC